MPQKKYDLKTSEDYVLIGESSAIREIREEVIPACSRSFAPVLIVGATGTGKHLVARQIHAKMKNCNGNFVRVDASLPDTLATAELFGYSPGAFTGARLNKTALVEKARSGVLFLDEVDRIENGVYEALNDILNSPNNAEYRGLGQITPKNSSFKLITASNQDLEKMVAEGTFREDFFYRVLGTTVRLPGLSERKEDIPILVDHFCSKYDLADFCAEAKTRLQDFDWPGNIRQLERFVWSIGGYYGKQIDVGSINSYLDKFSSLNFRKDQSLSLEPTNLAEITKKAILKSYERNGNNKTKTAKELDITVKTLRNKLKIYGVQ